MSGVKNITTKKFEVNSWGCPFCDYEVEADDDDQYIDDISDESDRKCPECGKTFQLRCVAMDLYFEASGGGSNG